MHISIQVQNRKNPTTSGKSWGLSVFKPCSDRNEKFLWTCTTHHQQGDLESCLASPMVTPHDIHLYTHAIMLTCSKHTNYLPCWSMAKGPIRIIAMRSFSPCKSAGFQITHSSCCIAILLHSWWAISSSKHCVSSGSELQLRMPIDYQRRLTFIITRRTPNIFSSHMQSTK